MEVLYNFLAKDQFCALARSVDQSKTSSFRLSGEVATLLASISGVLGSMVPL
jgi:hypothetical protein